MCSDENFNEKFYDLVSVVERLCSDGGCPWDLEQDHSTLKKYLIEEAYEFLDAVDNGEDADMVEELGDVLYQVLFHAQIAKGEGRFDIEDVVKSIHDKMIRRHPHVFAKDEISSSKEVLKKWEEIKSKEKKNEKRESILDGVPREMPSLLRAFRLQSKASRVGFDWDNVSHVFSKLDEELGEFYEAFKKGDKNNIKEELGDVFFVLANISRFLDIDPEDALKSTNDKFTKRFKFIETQVKKEGKNISDVPLERMEELWDLAKLKDKE